MGKKPILAASVRVSIVSPHKIAIGHDDKMSHRFVCVRDALNFCLLHCETDQLATLPRKQHHGLVLIGHHAWGVLDERVCGRDRVCDRESQGLIGVEAFGELSCKMIENGEPRGRERLVYLLGQNASVSRALPHGPGRTAIARGESPATLSAAWTIESAMDASGMEEGIAANLEQYLLRQFS